MRARWMILGALALLALTSGAAVAQGRGNETNRGQARKAQRRAEARFNIVLVDVGYRVADAFRLETDLGR